MIINFLYYCNVHLPKPPHLALLCVGWLTNSADKRFLGGPFFYSKSIFKNKTILASLLCRSVVDRHRPDCGAAVISSLFKRYSDFV